VGPQEIILLVAAKQVAQAVGALLKRASPGQTNPWAIAACAVGQQLASNAVSACAAGLAAANTEYAAQVASEPNAVQALNSLPPIS
jgi:hypothetical protein